MLRYLAHFWQIFYRSTGASDGEEQVDWSTISNKITWKNQLDLFEFHSTTPDYEEIEKKASAWFRVTYEPWITHVKNKQGKGTRTNTSSTRDHPEQERYRGLFSFAWLVYPVLLRIFQQREDTLDNNTSLKRKRKRTTYKKRKSRVLPSNKKNKQTVIVI